MYINVSMAEIAVSFLLFMFTKTCLFCLTSEMFDIETGPLYKPVRGEMRGLQFQHSLWATNSHPIIYIPTIYTSSTRSICLCYSQNISKQRTKQSERFSLWVLTKIKATDVKILTRVRTPTFSMAVEPVPTAALNPASPGALEGWRPQHSTQRCCVHPAGF